MLLALTLGKFIDFHPAAKKHFTASKNAKVAHTCSCLLTRRKLFTTSQELEFRAKRWLHDSMEAKRPDRWISLLGLEVVLPSWKEQEGGVQDLGSLVSSCLGAMSVAAQAESEVDFLD